MIKCEDCPYFWTDYHKNKERPSCHYRWDDGCAPCEIEDSERETEDIDED